MARSGSHRCSGGWRAARLHTERKGTQLIIGAGFLAPTVILTVVLTFALALLPDLLASTPGTLKIHVSGEQWWWRVQYLAAER